MIGFVARMAWRESRGGFRHFATLIACVVLGVAALVAVGTFAANVDRTLTREARALLGGDLELRASRPLGAEVREAVTELVRTGGAASHVRELVAMARHGVTGASLLVELKAVDGAYPLFGSVETVPAAPLSALLGAAGNGAVLDAGARERLGADVGDVIVVGGATLRVTAVLTREPDRPVGLVTLGPRVLVGREALERAGLVQTGSRVRYRTLVRLPDSLSSAVARERLGRALDDPGIRLSTFDEAQPGLRRFYDQLATYLGLVGLASLLIGAIGIAASVAAFVARQLPTIAVLKCLGATSRTLVATYVLQVLAVGVVGSVAGAVLGAVLEPVLIRALRPLVPLALEPALEPTALARGVAMGVLTTLLVSLWPLLAIRDIPPATLVRRSVESDTRYPRWRWRWLAVLPIAAALGALAVWQAGSMKLGMVFVGGALAALAVLFVLARGLAGLARGLPRARGIAWAHGIASLARPGGHTDRVVVALGTAVTLLVAIALLEAALVRQIDHEQRREAPSFFFVDLQADQRERFRDVLGRTAPGAAPTLTPVVRSRLAAIGGETVSREMVERRRAAGRDDVWYFTREYVLTSAVAPPAHNILIRGRWWTAAEAAVRPLVSVEEEAARRLGVDVGARVTFDVQGMPIEAEVMNLRKVDWQSLGLNFFVIFSEGALDGAPTTYVATARVPPAAERRVQDAVAGALPNVTAVPLRDILDRLSGTLNQISSAVRMVAVFSLGAGVVVMAGALAATRYQRLYESVILRTLGATRAAVARAFAVEYACLGVAAGVGGVVLASVLAWAILRFFLDVPWALEPDTLAAGVAAAVVTAVAVGFLGTFRLLGRKPLPVLRQE